SRVSCEPHPPNRPRDRRPSFPARQHRPRPQPREDRPTDASGNAQRRLLAPEQTRDRTSPAVEVGLPSRPPPPTPTYLPGRPIATRPYALQWSSARPQSASLILRGVAVVCSTS